MWWVDVVEFMPGRVIVRRIKVHPFPYIVEGLSLPARHYRDFKGYRLVSRKYHAHKMEVVVSFRLGLPSSAQKFIETLQQLKTAWHCLSQYLIINVRRDKLTDNNPTVMSSEQSRDCTSPLSTHEYLHGWGQVCQPMLLLHDRL